MKLRTLAGAALLALTPAVMVAQEENATLELTLNKAIEIGLNESPTIKVAELEIERVDYSRKEAIGRLLPVFAASADYSRTLKKQVMYFDGFSMGAAEDPTVGLMKSIHANDPAATAIINAYEDKVAAAAAEAAAAAAADGGMEIGRDNSWSAGFSMQLPIIAPQLWKSISLTQADVANALEKSRSSKLTLVNEIEKAYYNWILAKDSYEVLKLAYESAKLTAADYRAKYDLGLASEYDVLRSEVQVRNQEPGLFQAENGVSLAALQLKVLMGMDMRVELTTNDNLDNYQEEMYANVLSVDTTLSNNTTLRQLDLQTDYLEKALAVQKMAYYPTLSATGMYTWMSMNNDFKFKDYKWNPYSTVGLNLSVPIFQGGSRYFKVKQAKVGIAQMAYQRDNLVDQLNMQVEASMNNIEKAVKQVASNKEGVKQAEKANSIMEKSFEIGAATFIEVNDAKLALTNSRLAYNQAIYDYLTAESQLHLLLGDADFSAYESQK